jgi:hypothetical protein
MPAPNDAIFWEAEAMDHGGAWWRADDLRDCAIGIRDVASGLGGLVAQAGTGGATRAIQVTSGTYRVWMRYLCFDSSATLTTAQCNVSVTQNGSGSSSILPTQGQSDGFLKFRWASFDTTLAAGRGALPDRLLLMSASSATVNLRRHGASPEISHCLLCCFRRSLRASGAGDVVTADVERPDLRRASHRQWRAAHRWDDHLRGRQRGLVRRAPRGRDLRRREGHAGGAENPLRRVERGTQTKRPGDSVPEARPG